MNTLQPHHHIVSSRLSSTIGFIKCGVFVTLAKALHILLEGDGKTISVWHDRWDGNQALAKVISKRDIYLAGFKDHEKQSDLVDANGWKWHVEWNRKYSLIQSLNVPKLTIDKYDGYPNHHKSPFAAATNNLFSLSSSATLDITLHSFPSFTIHCPRRNIPHSFKNHIALKLLQLGTVEDYQREFEKLMNRVTDIPNSLLISFYISELKLNLQHEFLVSRPTTLGDAFSLAHITEARFETIAEIEQNIKEKAYTTLTLPSEEASPVVKGPLDASKDTLISLRSEDPNFKIQEKEVEYDRALNVAPFEVVFAGPLMCFVASLPIFLKIRDEWKRYLVQQSYQKVGTLIRHIIRITLRAM
nr:RNA-directed DNA polymerase, eukaryota, reverse transcriptase zinc-binding domain protein [Tanacetum cinerariifolium]